MINKVVWNSPSIKEFTADDCRTAATVLALHHYIKTPVTPNQLLKTLEANTKAEEQIFNEVRCRKEESFHPSSL